MINLTPRLSAIVNQVEKVNTAVDVGCDHAQVGIYLAESGKVLNMTVSDINDGPIARAREAVYMAGLSDKITCVKTDGLDGIEAQDCVIIAGMGGELIRDIITRAEWTKRNCRLILQPMSMAPVLRKFLFENGYKILRETIVREGEKLYTVLTVEPGEQGKYSEADLYLSDFSSESALEYLNKVIEIQKRALFGMKKAEKPDEREIERLKKLIKELEIRGENYGKGK